MQLEIKSIFICSVSHDRISGFIVYTCSEDYDNNEVYIGNSCFNIKQT
jgi:hypothetical protein